VCLPLQTLGDADRPNIEKRIESIIKDNQRFQRVVVSRDEALGMFQENKFKVRVWGGASLTVLAPEGVLCGCGAVMMSTACHVTELMMLNKQGRLKGCNTVELCLGGLCRCGRGPTCTCLMHYCVRKLC
jgi:hypothetical protein